MFPAGLRVAKAIYITPEGGVGGLAVFAALSILAEDLEFCKVWLSGV